MMMSQATDVYAAKVAAELLRRKYSIKKGETKTFLVGLGVYFLIEVEIAEEDLAIDVLEFADMMEGAFKKHLDHLHEEDLKRIAEVTAPPQSAPIGAVIIEDIEVTPKTIRDHVTREFLLVRSERLKRASK
jgi:hypothetical protein